MSQTKQPTNTGALATLVMVFFFWGFIAASNSIFIPFCKTHFGLNQFQSQLIGSAFYGAYFIGSLILFFVSNFLGYDIMNRIGYKKGIRSHTFFIFYHCTWLLHAANRCATFRHFTRWPLNRIPSPEPCRWRKLTGNYAWTDHCQHISFWVGWRTGSYAHRY